MNKVYSKVEAYIPYTRPTILDKELNINCFVYSDHTHNHVAHQPHTCIMIYNNMPQIIWFSKKQTKFNQVLLAQI